MVVYLKQNCKHWEFFEHSFISKCMMTCTNSPGGGGALHCKVEHHERDKTNLFFLSCITKMDQNFIMVFSWVDINDIYYILKIHNQIWWSAFLFFYKKTIPFLTRMRQNWAKTITIKNEYGYLKKMYTKDVINGCLYVEKVS